MMTKRLKSFAYYGGKFSKLDFILPQLETPHQTYVELCAGSAAVLLNKPQAKLEVLNDLAGEVINFWMVLRDHKDELIQAINDSPPGESEFKRVLSLSPSDDDVEMARRFYIVVQQAFSAVLTHYSHSFIRGALRYTAAQKNLDAVADRLRGVVIENTDASRLISRLLTSHGSRKDLQPVLFYVDPPYTADSRKTTGDYIHDDFDHDGFLDAVLNAPDYCKFAISGYDNDRYNAALAGWHRVELKTRLTANNRSTASKRTEVLWRNYHLTEYAGLF